MAALPDQTQDALHDALERASGEATLLLARAEQNENDGRAIIALLRGQMTALELLEQRLKNVEATAKALKRRNSRETTIAIIVTIVIAVCLGLAILSA
jgi:hypothetical protein